MNVKLTLRLDKQLIQSAKNYSKKRGKSVSQLVADLFTLIHTQQKEKNDLPPIVRSMKGLLKDKKLSEQDYKKYLEDKYL